ncbi:hypothetical protein [Methyloprofundus sp.]|uniref:hypothetical protein n=1 Tax=Methyloprofundus sp. TaxID=2020875 RepID=UPI003D1054B5
MQLREGSDGGVNLTTADKSCTHPTIPADGVLFRHTAYDSTDVADVREGYLEVIEMGEVAEDATIAVGSKSQLIASEGILHEQPSGVPFDCGVINEAWIQGVFVQGGAASNGVSDGGLNWVNPKPTGYPKQDITSAAGYYGQASMTSVDGNDQVAITAPTGGLVGSSILIDGAHVAGFVAEPASVTNYSTTAQHYLSSDENFYLLPSLASGNSEESDRVNVAETVTFSPVVRDWGLDDTDVRPRTSVPSGINPMPISDALLVTELGNQYFLSGGTLTDFVVSAPMRKHAIYNNYEYVAAGVWDADKTLPVKDIAVGITDPDASSDEKAQLAADNGYWNYLDATDVKAGFVYWNREEAEITPEPGDFSPPITTPDVFVPFEREVNILALNTDGTTDSVLGSDNAQSLTLVDGFSDGWVRFTFHSSVYDLAGSRYASWVSAAMTGGASAKGVPLQGFMSARANLGAQSLGETFPHFYKRDR